MAEITGSKAALPAFKEGDGAGIKKLLLQSNEVEGRTVDISTGLLTFSYYESILQDVVRATVTFFDTGDSVDGKTVMEGLPVYGTEMADIHVEDNNRNSIRAELLVNKPDDLSDDTRKRISMLNFASKEFFDNEKVRVNIRMDGLISKSVETILSKTKDTNGQGGRSLGSTTSRGGKSPSERKGFLNSEKEVFIEKTSNKRNFNGNNWKPFYTINWLAKQAVPSGQENQDAPGNSAGYMFWETAEGFHFKSIDALMNTETNPIKRKFLYNETAEGPCTGSMPEGYDAKVLEMTIDNRVDAQDKLKMGAYSSRTITFNPYDSTFDISYPNAFLQGANSVQGEAKNTQGNQENLKLAGEKFPYWNEEINQNLDFSRTEFRILDVGTLPEGKGSGEEGENQQLGEKSKEENSKPKETLNQGNMRMNQLFASKVVITIPGDFELCAGDAVYFDAPGLRASKNEKGTDEIDKHISGNYIISSICHYLDSSHTLTKMDLVRDSFGRKAPQRTSGTQRNNATSRTGSFQDRRNWRRSASASARANTNRLGQNIKTSSTNRGPRGRWAAKQAQKNR